MPTAFTVENMETQTTWQRSSAVPWSAGVKPDQKAPQ